jgi:hypothetical protein
VGDTVQVVKGRKVAKGTYEVIAKGSGDYNDYVHLRDKSGKEYRFINVANVVPHFSFEKMHFDSVNDPTLRALLVSYLASGCDNTPLYVFCDELDNRSEWNYGAELSVMLREKLQDKYFTDSVKEYLKGVHFTGKELDSVPAPLPTGTELNPPKCLPPKPAPSRPYRRGGSLFGS